MIAHLYLFVFMLAAATPSVWAEQASRVSGESTRILVTFSDPALGNSSRSGAPRPGYRRTSSTYLVSIGVKRSARRIARDFHLETVDEWPIASLKVHCLVFAVPEDSDVDDLLARLQQRPEVESAQRLNEFEVSSGDAAAPPKSYANLQHNLTTLELDRAHQWSRGDSTRVSIVDTGVDMTHPDLNRRISEFLDFVGDQAGKIDPEQHGTAVAGVIGADSGNGTGIVGVAPSSQLTVLRACWHLSGRSSAVCNTLTLAKALDHAINSDTDIINLSLSGPSDGLLKRLIEKAMDSDIVVIAAAPGQGLSGFPAEIEGVIVVGSYPRSDNEPKRSSPSIRAPGTDILVPVPNGGYDYASGTSLSAAQVSGVAALLIASRSDLTAGQIRSLLLHSQSGRDASVNACRALAELLSETGCQDENRISSRP